VEVDDIKWALKDKMVRKALKSYGIECCRSQSQTDGVVGAFVHGFQVTFQAGYKFELTAGKNLNNIQYMSWPSLTIYNTITHAYCT
jgi:hypothetical protein